MKKERNFNGDGTCYYSKSTGRWIAQLTDPITRKRKTVCTVKGEENDRRAEKKCRDGLKKAYLEINNNKYTEKTNITFAELAQEMIDTKFKAKVICESSYGRYNETLKVINSSFGNTKVNRLTESQIQDFLNNLPSKYSASAINKIFQLINQTLTEAVRRKIINRNNNPFDAVIKPKSDKKTKKVRAFTLDEQRKFVEIIKDHKYERNFLLALNTGMRAGEILALRPDDIDFEANVIHVRHTLSQDKNYKAIYKEDGDKTTKTYASTRDIPFDESVALILKDSIRHMTLNPNRVIFTNNGELIRTSTLNSAFKRLCEKAGIQIKKSDMYLTEHSLRHTYATRCLEAGMPTHVLQKLLGHTDVSLTINIYTDVFDTYKLEEMNKFWEYKKAQNL